MTEQYSLDQHLEQEKLAFQAKVAEYAQFSSNQDFRRVAEELEIFPLSISQEDRRGETTITALSTDREIFDRAIAASQQHGFRDRHKITSPELAFHYGKRKIYKMIDSLATEDFSQLPINTSLMRSRVKSIMKQTLTTDIAQAFNWIKQIDLADSDTSEYTTSTYAAKV